MSTTTDYQELTRRSQEQYLDAVRDGQQAVVEAVSAWAQAVQTFTSTTPPVPVNEHIPNPDAVIDDTFDLFEKLVASQREFAHKLIAAAAPAAEGARAAGAQAAAQTPPTPQAPRVAKKSPVAKKSRVVKK